MFHISKGTHQGYALSSLLFIVILEVLRKIRKDEQMKGLKIGEQHLQVRAFPVGMVLFLEDPMQTIMQFKETINNLGEQGGFVINEEKTIALQKKNDDGKGREGIRNLRWSTK